MSKMPLQIPVAARLRRIACMLFTCAITPGICRADCPRQWIGWQVLPGGGTFDSAPAAIFENGRTHLFAINRQSIITNILDVAAQNWTGWEEVPGGGKTDQGLASAAVGSGLYLFAKGVADKKVYVNVMALPQGAWTGWQAVPGQAITDRPLAAATARGKLFLFAKSLDGRILFNILSASSNSWAGWKEVPGNWRTDAALAAASTPDSLYLITKGLDQAIYVNRLEVTTGAWAGWNAVPGAARTDLAMSATIDGDSLALVSHGINDRHQYYNRMSLVDRIWSGWRSVDGGGTTATTTAATATPTKLLLFSEGAAVRLMYMNELGPDTDCDGVADTLERQMLARFRPFYRFSLDDGPDKYHPMDALSFVQNGTLLDAQVQGSNVVLTRDVLANDPGKLLHVYTNIWGWTDRRQGPDSVTPYQLQISLDKRTGEHDLAKIRSSAVGLYGHVAPIRSEVAPIGAITGYKIEYWQFYGYNDAPIDAYRHEGDWESVQLVIGDDQTTITEVIHDIHSTHAVFVTANTKRVDVGGGVIELRGPNYGTSFWGPAGDNEAQENVVRLFCMQGSCTHPVVYIEHSGHASWPTAGWGWVGARKHNGDGDAYLVATPCNLGEISVPDPSCPGSEIIINFNGHWGAGGDGPEGPAMKSSWGRMPAE